MNLQAANARAPCRKCGTMLSRQAHLGTKMGPVKFVEEYDRDGQRRSRMHQDVFETHVPCPNCGEAKPIINKAAARARVIFLIAFLGIWAAGLYLLFYL